MKYLFTILLSTLSILASAQNTAPTKFDSLKTRAQLDIKIPDGYKELDIPFLHKIPHQLAISPADSSCQVRYYIRPLDTWMADYNKKSKKEQSNSMHPNALCKSMMMLAVLDASNNKEQGYQVSQDMALTKLAYNADWEASTIIETGWPQVGFKYCYIWSLHKDDIADVYIYLLANNKKDFPKIIAAVAPLIKFK